MSATAALHDSPDKNHPPRMLKLPELMARLQISKSSAYRKINTDPAFPQPVLLGARAMGFVEEEVTAYLYALIARRDAKGEGT